MKIITYSKEGAEKSVRAYPDFVPDYIKHFDDDRSPLNITKDDIRIINHKEKTFEQTLVLSRLSFSVRHDYANYLRTINIAGRSFPFFEDFFQITDDETIEKTFHSILELSIDKESSLTASHILTCDVLINALYQYSVEKTKTFQPIAGKADFFNEILKRQFLYNNFCEAVGQYYNALKKMRKVLTQDFRHQMYLLYPFLKCKVTHSQGECSNALLINDPDFMIKGINTLYRIKGTERKFFYRLLSAFESMQLYHDLHIKDYSLGRSLHSVIKQTEISLAPVTIKLNHYLPTEFSEYVLETNDDIAALGDPHNSPFIDEIVDVVNNIYAEYTNNAVITHAWQYNVNEDADIYSKSQLKPFTDWLNFYSYKVDDIKKTSANNGFKPQYCYFGIAVKGKHSEFDDSTVRNLLRILIQNRSDDQTGLYECRYKLDYAWKKMEAQFNEKTTTDPVIKSINNALLYIDPIFTSDYVNPNYRLNIKDIITELLHLQDLKDLIVQSRPNGFNGGFNLQLVYCLLGLLIDENGGYCFLEKQHGKTLDRFLAEKNLNKKPAMESYIVERKHYILDYKSYKPYKSFHKKIEEVLDMYKR